MYTRIHVFLFFMVFFISCSNKEELYFTVENSRDYDEKIQIQFFKQTVIELPPNASETSSSVDYSNFNGNEILSFIDTKNNSLVFIDLQSQEVFKELELDIEGGNGVGMLDITAYHKVINFDSIFILNPWKKTLFLINDQGQIYAKFKVDLIEGKYAIMPELSTMKPLRYAYPYIYMPCGIGQRMVDYTNHPFAMKINLLTGEQEYLHGFSNLYSNYFWGAYFKYHADIEILGNDSLLVSFPVDPFFYFYNTSNSLVKGDYVGSKYFGMLSPMKDASNYWQKVSEEDMTFERKYYSLTNSDYCGLFYDGYRDLIIRSAYVRKKVEKNTTSFPYPDLTFIFLDKNLKKGGEFLSKSKEYSTTMFFLSREGLNLIRKDSLDQVEGKWFIDTYSITVKD